MVCINLFSSVDEQRVLGVHLFFYLCFCHRLYLWRIAVVMEAETFFFFLGRKRLKLMSGGLTLLSLFPLFTGSGKV